MRKIALRVIAFMTALMITNHTLPAQTSFWQQTNGPYVQRGSPRFGVYSFAGDSAGRIFAGTADSGVYRSTDNGDSWTQINMGLTFVNRVYCLVTNDSGHVFVGTDGGVSRSTNQGDQWTEINTGLTNVYIRALAINDSSHIFAGTLGGMFRSTNNGETWTPINSGLTDTLVSDVAINHDGHIFAGTFGYNLFRSTNNGETWFQTNWQGGIYSLAVDSDENVFVGSDHGVYRSTDDGDAWTQSLNLSWSFIVDLDVSSSGDLFAGGFIYDNEGQYYGTGVWRSTDGGGSWNQIEPGFWVEVLFVDANGNIFVATIRGSTWISAGVFRSTDEGGSWTQILARYQIEHPYASAFVINSNGHVFVGTEGDGIFVSTDEGDTWTHSGGTDAYVHALAVNSSGVVFAGTSVGVFRSTDNGQSWTRAGASFSTYIHALAINANNDIFAGSINGGVFRSMDSGENWTRVDPGFPYPYVYALAINSSGHIFAGTYSFDGIQAVFGGLFRSTDNGASWIDTHLDQGVWTIAIGSNGNVFAGTHYYSDPVLYGQIFRSADDGGSWTALNLNCPAIWSIAINSFGHVFVGTQGSGPYRSTDNGENWVDVSSGLSDQVIPCLAIRPSGRAFAGTASAGVFRSAEPATSVEMNSFTATADRLNAELHWSTATEVNNYGFEIERRPASLPLSNAGWKKIGFVKGSGTSSLPHEYSFLDLNIAGGKYAYRIKQIDADGSFTYTNAIEIEVGLPLPVEFNLAQNYPNPFNPSTTIEFDLPQSGYVILKVFNALGEEVETVISQELEAGFHSVRWNAGTAASGVYFYRLTAGDYTQTKKFLLTR